MIIYLCWWCERKPATYSKEIIKDKRSPAYGQQVMLCEECEKESYNEHAIADGLKPYYRRASRDPFKKWWSTD